MKKNQHKTIGIIGGMGPEATLDLYQWIIKRTPATKDQDHIPTLIYSLPQIPDRTQALLYGGESPLPYLIKAARVLEAGGTDFITIPCNTAHAFIPQLQKKTKTPIINMISETVKYIKRQHPKVKTVGLLTTTGTLKSKLYQKALTKQGLRIIIPSKTIQKKKVMEAIYGPRGVKARSTSQYAKKLLISATEYLVKEGAQAIIMGCTETPLALEEKDVSCFLINPTKILAESAIMAADRQLPFSG